jgi:hypothetical protein
VGPKWTSSWRRWTPKSSKPLLDALEQLKAEGLTSTTVAISFCRRLIQPFKDRAH